MQPVFFDSKDELSGTQVEVSEEEDQSEPEDSAEEVSEEKDQVEPEVITAKEISQMEFDTLPFEGYYKELLSCPERNFWMVVYGPPWQGKSTFCVGFAKYLGENMGNVLYISSEQFRSQSLKKIVNDVQASGLNQIHFTRSAERSPSFAKYDFIFFDSVNAGKVTVEDIEKYREEFPEIAFICVLQSVKSGDFHGKQAWRHEPDIVVRIEDQKADVEKNRFLDHKVWMPLPEIKTISQIETENETSVDISSENSEDISTKNSITEFTKDEAESMQHLLCIYDKKRAQELGALDGKKEKVKRIDEIPEVTLRYLTGKPKLGKITRSKDSADFARSLFEEGELEVQEQFFVILLNRNNSILGYYKMSKGGTSTTVVDSKLIFAMALKSLANSLVLVHNHPSGSIKPSENDIRLTRKIKEGGLILDILVLDHIILTSTEYFSFADEGLL